MVTIRFMKLGEKLAKLRAGRPYAEIARIAGCSTPTIRDIESGSTVDPGIMLISKMAAHYSVSLDWLVDETKDWPPPATPAQNQAEILTKALSQGGLLGELNSQERDLLVIYRSLPESERTRMIGYAQGCQVKTGVLNDASPSTTRKAEDRADQGYDKSSEEEELPDVVDAIQTELGKVREKRRFSKGHGKAG